MASLGPCRFIGIGAKSLVLSATLPTLRCLISYRIPKGPGMRALVYALSWFSTQLNPLGDPSLTGHTGTPKPSYNSNNNNLLCYALVTHNRGCQAWKHFQESGLQKFLALWVRSLKSSWLGQRNSRISGKAWERLLTITPKTPETPVRVTHKLRTSAFFPRVVGRVFGQTQKQGVMPMLCVPFHAVWADQNSGTNIWQRSE
jgi:hypothetical protein